MCILIKVIVNECSNTCDTKIKAKPIDVKSSTYMVFGVENNDKDPNW